LSFARDSAAIDLPFLSINPQDREINDGESSARPIDPDPAAEIAGSVTHLGCFSGFGVPRRVYHFAIRRIDSTLVPGGSSAL